MVAEGKDMLLILYVNSIAQVKSRGGIVVSPGADSCSKHAQP